MQHRYRLLMAGLLGLALGPWPPGPASASCVAPYLTDTDQLVLTRDADVSVQGRAFVVGCRDTMTCSGVLGCESCAYDEPPEEPMEDVRLQLRQQGRTWTLGTADAGSGEHTHPGSITWTVAVPDQVHPGRARLVAEGARPVAVRVR